MGLAASQVRMLSLTSRKASIERDILQSSNRKIALSREMNNLANEYYDALSAEKLMYLSDTGEYTNLSYQYLMGKPGGIEDIDVKSDNSMLLIDTLTGKVVLSSEMCDIINSCGNLSNNANNIYLAISKLCGDVNITPTVEGGIISPNLIKDICAGKYDTFDVNDLTDAIHNEAYWLWTIDHHTVDQIIENSVHSTMLQDTTAADLGVNLTNLEDFCDYDNMVAAYQNDKLCLCEYLETEEQARNCAKVCARFVAADYFGVDSYNDLSLDQKIAVAEVMKNFEIGTTSDPDNENLDSTLLNRQYYAYIQNDPDDDQYTPYKVYMDTRLFLNALYTATHLENANTFTLDTRYNVNSLYGQNSGDTTPISIGNVMISEDNDGSSWETPYSSTIETLYGLSDQNNYLVQIGSGRAPINVTDHTFRFLDVLIDKLYSGATGDVMTYLQDVENNAVFNELFADNNMAQYDGTLFIYNNQSSIPTSMLALDETIAEDLFDISPNDDDASRIKIYYAHCSFSPAHSDDTYFTYADVSALTAYYYAKVLGENIGYGYDVAGNFQFFSPTSNMDNEVSDAAATSSGAYTPYLNLEQLTKLVKRMNATKDEVFASNVTVTQVETQEILGAGPNSGKEFTPAGEIESQWIKNFKDLINDVKFYFTIVTACAKFGMTSGYDQNLKDSDYIDKNIQNGVFQLMGFDTKLFSLESAKDTDYYLLTSEFSKMNDPAQQAIITAWYETEKAEINSKETYLDTQIENLSIELNSIKTEIESVKTLIDDAVKQTFDWGKG